MWSNGSWARDWNRAEEGPVAIDTHVQGPVFMDHGKTACAKRFGLAYWYLLYPLNSLVFADMIRGIARESRRPKDTPSFCSLRKTIIHSGRKLKTRKYCFRPLQCIIIEVKASTDGTCNIVVYSARFSLTPAPSRSYIVATNFSGHPGA